MKISLPLHLTNYWPNIQRTLWNIQGTEQDTQDSVATSGTADNSEDVEPEQPLDDLQNEFTPNTCTEPEQSQSPTSQPIVENRQPRIRRPPVRMTYDVPGQPKFYPGVTTNMNMVTAAASLPPLWLSTPPQYPPLWYFPQ